MWKKTLLSLLIAGYAAVAVANQQSTTVEKTWTESDITALKQSWLEEQKAADKKRQTDRTHFLQLENLLNTAAKQKTLSPTLLSLAESLISPDYPLQEEAAWLVLNAKIAAVNADTLAQTVEAMQTFAAKYPNTAKRQQLEQRPFALYFQFQQIDSLLKYAEKTTPNSLENRCRLLAAKWQHRPQQSSEQATTAPAEPVNHEHTLLQEFEQLWLETGNELPAECSEIEQAWQNAGLKTAEKVREKAVKGLSTKTDLVKLGEGLTELTLADWLRELQNLRDNPTNLQHFAEKQPLDPWNKAVLLERFPAFIKTQPETIGQTELTGYLNWAEKFQLSADEQTQWKILFFNRAFDNPNEEFSAWRDTQLAELKADNLTERRLRMAIWQKTDQKKWLDLLSNEAKNKQEWRYWLAKNDPQQRETQLTALSQERGFYPMLAAHTLGKLYQFNIPKAEPLSEAQLTQYQAQLERIAELRRLNRIESAKLVWLELLQAVDFAEKIALSDYALKQDWYDLAVEGTIQAKAWDYIDLRLPDAYADWFKLHLSGKTINRSFAMAIARQESAWNAQVRSHANAIGLMQMLPTTAKQTAEQSGLPFAGESDLLRPFNNIMLGTTHLQELNEKYPNNRILIASAYNAGPHRVTQWLERAGGKLAMDEFIASIPFFETRGYVQNVLAYDFYYQLLQGSSSPVPFNQEEQRLY